MITSHLRWPVRPEVEQPWVKLFKALDSNPGSWKLTSNTAFPKVCSFEHKFYEMLYKGKFSGSGMFRKYWVNHILVGFFSAEFLLRSNVYLHLSHSNRIFLLLHSHLPKSMHFSLFPG